MDYSAQLIGFAITLAAIAVGVVLALRRTRKLNRELQRELAKIPAGAIFEPGYGDDLGPNGETRGGYVIDIGEHGSIPEGWYQDNKRPRVAYSPGHSMKLMLDPELARTPRADFLFPGHHFTYAPNPERGYVIPKHLRGFDYYVAITHPWAATRNEEDEEELRRRSSALSVNPWADQQTQSRRRTAAYVIWYNNTFGPH